MKILYVEDSAAAALVMTRRLSSFGNAVTLATNGREAVEKFRSEAPDLVLMDIEMPVMNGFEAAHQIRTVEAAQQWAWTPIIFLTASDTIANLVTAIEAGGDDFMAKTVPEPVLQAKMKAMARIANLRHGLSDANRKLEHLAHHDGLTGLCNRQSMDMRSEVAFRRCQEAQRPFGVLMLDIDNFKKCNDHYGHQQGDACLRQVAAAIRAVVEGIAVGGAPGEAFAARYGGEEFAVVVPECSRAQITQLGEDLLHAVRTLHLLHTHNADWGIVTVSVGLAHQDLAQGALAELFRAADQQLYQAKRLGRNRLESGAPSL